MKRLIRYGASTAVIASCAVSALAQDKDAPAPKHQATTVYRQVMPDGRIVYADKLLKGGKLDQTITVEQPIKGNLWTTESGPRPAIPPQVEPTPINRVNAIPASGRKKTIEEATSDVIHAEMLLEDAKKRQQAGRESLERGTHSKEAVEARRQALANDVAEADAALRRAIAQRDALRNAR